MLKLTLTETEAQTLRHALEIAAEQFKRNADKCREMSGYMRLADQFDRQIKETLALAERIEELA